MTDKRVLLEDGWEYQDFVAIQLQRCGIVLNNLQSKRYQVEYGENLLGMEIKLDRNFARTGNLYIEVAEKSDAQQPAFVPSGIFAADHAWLYAVGDYAGLFVFVKHALRAEWDRCLSSRARVVETLTSRGFLLARADAQRLAVRRYEFNGCLR